MNKVELRARYKALLAAQSEEQRIAGSELACGRLLSTPFFASAFCIMVYSPLPEEVDCSLIARECLRTGRTLCVPRIDWDESELIPARVFSWPQDLVAGRKGVREPAEDMPLVSVGTIDLVVVPGLAFDRNRMRLGRGGGFYDRFLARNDLRATKAGLGFDLQLLSELPAEPHDSRLDSVVVESEIL
jgi:5-formyltetrahydrofolate cyclo-ligase